MDRVWTWLLDLLFPPRCAGCGTPGPPLCPACEGHFVRLSPPLCACCGAPTAAGRLPCPGGPDGSGSRCAACRRSPPPFALARSVFVYDGVLRAAIGALKYRRRRAVAGPLGRLLAALAPQAVLGGVEAVVPVPLHPARLRTRGYNQAELLAQPVAAMLGVPCLSRGLRRFRQESAQADLGARSRWSNVADAFAPGEGWVGRSVLLVDDVFSTGATAGACARALQAAGASQVTVLTLARTVLGVRSAGIRRLPARARP